MRYINFICKNREYRNLYISPLKKHHLILNLVLILEVVIMPPRKGHSKYKPCFDQLKIDHPDSAERSQFIIENGGKNKSGGASPIKYCKKTHKKE